MVDVADSKSADGDIVWVRVPPPAPFFENPGDVDAPGFSLIYQRFAGFSVFFFETYVNLFGH